MLTCVVRVLAVALFLAFASTNAYLCSSSFSGGTLLVTAFASTNAYLCSSGFSGGTLLVTAFASTNAYLCSSGFSGGTLLVTAFASQMLTREVLVLAGHSSCNGFCLNKCLPV